MYILKHDVNNRGKLGELFSVLSVQLSWKSKTTVKFKKLSLK